MVAARLAEAGRREFTREAPAEVEHKDPAVCGGLLSSLGGARASSRSGARVGVVPLRARPRPDNHAEDQQHRQRAQVPMHARGRARHRAIPRS